MDTLRDLTSRHPNAGRVEAIYLRPGRGESVNQVQAAQALVGEGLEGDRAALRERSSVSTKARDITLMQSEVLPILAAWAGRSALDAGLLRRNLLVSGLNLTAMRSPFADGNNRWAIGNDVIIEITGPCEPCSKMERALGHGGYNMMRGYGGLTAAILTAGLIRIGDVIRPARSASG